MSRGDHRAALEAFDQVVAIAPDFAEGWNKRATVHYLMDNLDQSLEVIARTLELEPRHFGALSGRGLVYAKLDDLERALDSFEAAVAVNPQMVGPRINAEAIRQILKKREIQPLAGPDPAAEACWSCHWQLVRTGNGNSGAFSVYALSRWIQTNIEIGTGGRTESLGRDRRPGNVGQSNIRVRI